MLTFLYILLGLSLFAVVFTLVMGGRAMTKREENSSNISNKWMWRRVWAQFTALIILGLTVVVKRNGG